MIRYEALEGTLPPSMLTVLLDLHFQIFSVVSREAVQEEIGLADSLYTLLAYDEERLIGYKIGYRRKPGHFYSWLGGVLPDYRKRGVASELMKRQHRWCKQQGYLMIRTQTMNRWRDMLILNLRHGFDIVGIVAHPHQEPKIILEKKLT